MLNGWKSTQKNQASRMYPGTSQASFFRFSSLSQIDMLVLMPMTSDKDNNKGLFWRCCLENRWLLLPLLESAAASPL